MSEQSGRRSSLSIDQYAEGLTDANRTILARAITLIESSRPDDRQLANALLDHVLPLTGNSLRIGISGVPGVGKSTFIEAFGMQLIEAGHKVAVLAVDPTSTRTGGSILGDKTRMQQLSRHPSAYVRPSPTGGELGGVARTSRETILLCEAAGFDIVLVETVGVGQSEVTVDSMVDFFLVLMLAGAGDELQGIKKGIIEIADLLVVNKADSADPDKLLAARQAVSQYQRALDIIAPRSPHWSATAMSCSALHSEGIEEIQKIIEQFRASAKQSGEMEQRRQTQRRQWLWTQVEERLLTDLRLNEQVQSQLSQCQSAVDTGKMTPSVAADELIAAYLGSENR